MSDINFDQKKIWDHFQNEGVESFSKNVGRLEFLLRHLKSNSTVLNIGVGNGYLELICCRKGVQIHSLDPSDRAITKIRESLGISERAKVGQSQNIPFPADYFDVVVMSEVLEHLELRVFDTTLHEVFRVLKSGGLFIGTVPAREDLEEALVVCPHCANKFHRWGHTRSFDNADLRLELEKLFCDVTVEEHYFVEWDSVGVLGKLKGLLKKILSHFDLSIYGKTRNIFFVAKKDGG